MVVCAIITALLALLAFIGIRQYTDLLGPARSKSPEVRAAGKDQRAAGKDQIDISTDPIADGTANYVTLYPAEVGSSAWEIGENAVSGLLFRAPKDKRKWLKLIIQKKQHFKAFYIGIFDYRDKTDNNVPDAVNVKEGDQIHLKTQSFKADITFVEAKTSSDPDREQPYEKVFEKVILKIIIAEQQEEQTKPQSNE
jgi:hypothetical protein